VGGSRLERVKMNDNRGVIVALISIFCGLAAIALMVLMYLALLAQHGK
jgi:hypothetical protein